MIVPSAIQHHANGACLAPGLDSTPPSLDAIASSTSPTEALSKLSPDQLAVLAGQCATIQIAITIITRAATVAVAPTPAPTPTPDSATRLLDASAIAQRTGFALSYVYELIRSGSLRAVKVGKYRRVTESALAEWIARHETQAR